MNSNSPSTQHASTRGKPILNAVILASLGAVAALYPVQASAAAADAASANAPPTATHRTERVISDSWITTKVKSEILKSSLAKGFDVKVVTLHGIVTLKGTLASEAVIDQVKAIAAKVKGVQSVDTSTLVATAK